MRWIKDKILWILGAVAGAFFFAWRAAQSKARKAEVKQSRAEDSLEAEKSKSEIKVLETEAKNAEEHRKSLVDAFRSGDRDDS